MVHLQQNLFLSLFKSYKKRETPQKLVFSYDQVKNSFAQLGGLKSW